ncbi:MAG TPA: PQQ-dependent dehydrogenase, methanol/ethanol family [Sphingobium sp.]|nr:PQQ-dependent dehydrogenase, methanol/ethanol family [Sphingobium sp.]
MKAVQLCSAAMLVLALVSCNKQVGPGPYGEGAVSAARMEKAAAEPENWLVNGGTYQGQYYSTLDQINEANVVQLAPTWYFEFDTTRGQEAEPIVVDGVMYVSTAWSKVYALDAKTGEQIWFFDPRVPGKAGVRACCDVVNRGVAVYDGKVYVGTIDGRLIALRAKDGKEVWSVQTTDPKQMYAITAAPRVAKGKVIIGNAGADFGVRGYVSAYDAQTGKMAWRFYLVPGDPKAPPDGAASDSIMKSLVEPTWSGEWYKYGGGGTAWNTISYDPEFERLYIGTGNGSPWNHAIRSNGKGDNLFVASIVALDVNTGEYVWHYQENPAESWDYNSVQPIMLADMKIGNSVRKVLYHAPKNGFFYVIDRSNGKLISANPFVRGITWAKRIDLATGRPVEPQGSRFENGPFLLSPGLGGAHGIAPMARNPKTGLIYFQVSENSMMMDAMPNFVRKEGGPSNTGVVSRGLGAKNFFIAFDPANGQTVWKKELTGGGALATASGLVFQARGNVVGELAAYRATDGKELWSYPTPNFAMPAPITYMIDGVQYIAIVSGFGGPGGITAPSVNSYAPQPGRVVVFKLGGTAKLPPDPGRAPPANPAKEKWTPAQVEAGSALFTRNCARCHSAAAVSPNIVPDLRRSASLPNKDLWQQIVYDGLLESNGMVGWSTILTRDEIDLIRGFVSSQAEKLKSAGDPAPVRPKRFVAQPGAEEAQ